MAKEEIQQDVNKIFVKLHDEYAKAKSDYDKKIAEIDKEIYNLLPLKVGDVLTKYYYEHNFRKPNALNLPAYKERVKITSILYCNIGFLFKYQKYSKRKKGWLVKESKSYINYIYELYEKDGVFYEWSIEPAKKEYVTGMGFDLPTPDMKIKEV